ncbi:MAG: hypothetical protein AAF657_25565 [Acidobacteriota bacterium]
MFLQLLKYLPIYITCIALAGLLWQRPLGLLCLYVAISVLILWKFHAKGDLIYYFVPFFMGPLGELLPVALGAWTYSKPLWMIPMWLPFVWGLAGLFMRRTSVVLEQHFTR